MTGKQTGLDAMFPKASGQDAGLPSWPTYVHPRDDT
ncbi:uncharacterized protein METZ01_LOCUS337761 [marine metagenome]|uniref:Uncharacterized protein n=1 Tax=marine metagenome TaxID=408172 RepID=A0A382QIT5_9ZZZZ